MRAGSSKVEDDLAAKKSLIKQCKNGEWQLDRQCSNYAKQAVSQNDLNLRNECGFTRKSRWHSRFMDHYEWCSNHSPF